jgi:hypothetical protein
VRRPGTGDARFADVHKHVLEGITNELTKAAAKLTAPSVVNSAVQPYGRTTVMGLTSESQALDGREITHQHAMPKTRITAPQFEFYRNGVVRHAGQPITQPIAAETLPDSAFRVFVHALKQLVGHQGYCAPSVDRP